MVRIVISDALHPSASELLRKADFEVLDVSSDKDKLKEALKEADGIIVRSATKVRSELLELAPNLKIVGRAGVGLDNVDLDECKNRGIKVVNSPEGPTRSVAELVLGTMISLARKLIILDQGTKSGNWPKKTKGQELYGKTVGIVGSGMIGGQFAKYCIALGMKVIAYDIVKIPELEMLDGFDYVELNDVFHQSDVISIHVPLLPATKHMINKDAIDKMKDGVLIINAARGGVIDEDALSDGIKSKKVGGAALDVFETEPVPVDHPLLKFENVITTPHIGAQTIEANVKNAQIVCQKIIDHFS